MVPWHPMLVHFPLALLPLSFAVDVVGWASRRPRWHRSAYGLLLLGTLGAVAAVLSGNAAAAAYRGEETVLAAIERHEVLATPTLLLLLAIALGRLPLFLRDDGSGQSPGWPLKAWVVVAGLGCALLWQTGLSGGELVYRHGVGVQVLDRAAARPPGPAPGVGHAAEPEP